MAERYHDPAPPGLAPAPGCGQVVSAAGRMVFVAGQVALDAQGAVVGAGDPARQAEQVFENIAAALRAAGTSFREVVKLDYYLVDIGCLPVIRPVRDLCVDTANPPAATAVEVKALFRPELLLEIEAMAVAGAA